MPRYIIHIGPHKTGSTYLQVLFHKLSPQLRARGIHYPLQWVDERTPGHSLLFQRLRTGNDPALADEFLELNASDSEIVLISSEDLAGLSLDQIELLKSYLKGQPASVIFYCRRWLDLLPSAWQENVKHGQSTDLPEFLATNFMNPFASNVINYGVRLDRFEQAFGIENMFLASYSNIMDQGGDLGEHFFRVFLSWPDAPVDHGMRFNVSLGIQDIEMIRVLNALEWAHSQRRTAEVRVRYLGAKSELKLSIPLAAMESHRGTLRANENAPGLRILHDELFAKYGDRLVPPKSGRYFFVQGQGGIDYIKQDYLLVDGVVEALRTAYNKIRE
jgi:hypothetical protein